MTIVPQTFFSYVFEYKFDIIQPTDILIKFKFEAARMYV